MKWRTIVFESSTAEEAKLLEFLAPYPPHVQELALMARIKALSMFDTPSEIFWDATQAVCIGVTHTHNPRECFFNFAVYANHVTMIFPWGVKHQDPEGRLRGEGNQVRNIRLTSFELLDDPYVVDQIRQAEALAARTTEPLSPIQIVKVMNGPKRRPTP